MSSKYKGGYIAVSEGDKYKTFNESFKGVVTDIETKFPKGLGASHPFNFDDIEKLYIKYAIVSEAVNKLTNSVITEFQIKLKNPNAQAIIDSFIHDTDFYTVLSAWVREGFLKGNGFIELDLTDIKIRVMNANNMYVKRNSVGKVLGYAQWSKSFKSFNKNSTDLTTFKPNQIAHITINKIPNDPYGIGIIFPNERIIENLVKNEQDLQTIISRKSGQPYHFKVGQPGTNVPSSVVDAIKSKLQYLTKTTEWVTDGDIDIKTIDFGNIGKNITESQLYFFKQFIAGTGIPEVLFGSGQLNEGIAKVQLESYKQRVKSYQNQIAHIIEEKIIKPLLKANGLDVTPIFIWDLPSEDDINKRIDQIQKFLSTTTQISLPLRAAMEIKLSQLFKLTDLDNILIQPQQVDQIATSEIPNPKTNQNLERNKEMNIPQPEVPGAKSLTNEKKCHHNHDIVENSGDMSIKEWVNIKEIAGFNYIDYLTNILLILKTENFKDLKAITESDVAKGLLKESDIEKLRQILKDGFKGNQTINEIEKNIKDNIDLKNRITDTSIILAVNRPNMIARTETVRVANEGLIKLYKTNKIKEVRWLSSISKRTCARCASLDGKIFNINEAETPPLHTNCRCSLLSVVE